jgi:hypothetical protein
MQFFAVLLQGGVTSLLGWVLIAGGLALAAHTLTSFARPSRRAARLLRAYRPSAWGAPQPALTAAPHLDAAGQWQRLVDIADGGLAQVDTIAELHARAASELQAAEQALRQLLDEWGDGPTLEAQPEPLAPPASASHPLAA